MKPVRKWSRVKVLQWFKKITTGFTQSPTDSQAGISRLQRIPSAHCTTAWGSALSGSRGQQDAAVSELPRTFTPDLGPQLLKRFTVSCRQATFTSLDSHRKP